MDDGGHGGPQDDLGRARTEIERLQAELTRRQAEIDRLRNDLAARTGGHADSGSDKGSILESTLFISEIEVRGAIARQLRNGARLLQASKCVYLLFDGNEGLSAQRPALGLEEEELSTFRTLVTRGISGEVFRTRKPVKLDVGAEDERASEEPLREIGVKNGICVPLLVQIRDEENRVIDSKPIGVLWVMNRRGGGQFSDDDERLLTVFARQVAAVISNAEFFRHIQQTNQTLVTTFENLPAGLLFIDTDERVQLINGTARRIFQVPDGRGTGEVYYRLITHQSTCEVLGSSLMKDEDQVAEVPFEVDDEERIFQIQAARVRGGEDSLNGVVAIFDDVSEVKRLDRMKAEFVQTFSNELLGPLASIQGFTAMLQKVDPDEFDGGLRREIHTVVNTECQRLRRHIQDLLNVSRLEQGIRVHLNTTRFDLGALVRRVVEREGATERLHRFEFAIAADVPPIVADEGRLEEVVYNLVSNAVKYSPDGGAIEVRVRPVSEGVRVEVTDHGLGIAKEHHEQIFQKFARLQQTDERVRGGRGIGLFISRFFIEAHGGQIGLDSDTGQGTTFFFTLPLEPMGDSEPKAG